MQTEETTNYNAAEFELFTLFGYIEDTVQVIRRYPLHERLWMIQKLAEEIAAKYKELENKR